MTTYSELQKQYMMKQITEEEYQNKKAARKAKIAKHLKAYFDGEISKEEYLSITKK
jgi:hypothetical protein